MAEETGATSSATTGVFDTAAAVAGLPGQAESMLVDHYFTDQPAASTRVLRIYRDLPLHYHESCAENLFVLSGSATLHLDGAEHEVRAGHLLVFDRRVVHGFPRVGTGEPLVVLSIDVPRRRPDDIVFVDPTSGTAGDFMARNR